jgi:hypothetical protein
MPIAMLDRHHFVWAGSFLCALAWNGKFYFYSAGNWHGPYGDIGSLELHAAGAD